MNKSLLTKLKHNRRYSVSSRGDAGKIQRHCMVDEVKGSQNPMGVEYGGRGEEQQEGLLHLHEEGKED